MSADSGHGISAQVLGSLCKAIKLSGCLDMGNCCVWGVWLCVSHLCKVVCLILQQTALMAFCVINLNGLTQ